VRGTTGETSTGRGTPAEGVDGAPTGVVGDVDLPTRMLVFGVARHDGSIRAVDVFDVARACGRSDEQVRSCLRRLVAEGLFVRDDVGRRAVYRASDTGLRALARFGGRALRAHAQDAERDMWDGRWHLVAFAVPEARRAARDALRDRLGLLGGALVHNGLYVSAHPWDKDVLAVAGDLGVAGHVTLAVTADLVVGGDSDPPAIAARLWPLGALAARYRAFLDRWSPVLDRLASMERHDRRLPDSAFLPGALAMAVEYRSCLDDDPLLPPELLPRPWPGRAARQLLVDSRRLALRLRAERGLPPLFATFDDMVDALPVPARQDAGRSPGGPP
jgi:phenylacetic acid degradation operon negative regulatory protein